MDRKNVPIPTAINNTIKKSSVIGYGEGDISYNSRTKTIAIYDGGTSNNNSFYAIA